MKYAERDMGCADCHSKGCSRGDDSNPAFCQGRDLPEGLLGDVMREYEDPEIRRVTIAAAETESENYCRMTRMEETAEFARKLEARRIGIAYCMGLQAEANIAARILRKKGFQVVAISCKCGEQPKQNVGIPEACNNTGANMCNPILQAKFLNAENTELNILIGLCVGHDSLFYKYADGLVTTLVAKDRVLAHNTAAALYQADKYLKLL